MNRSRSKKFTLKHIESCLQDIQDFEEPIVELEQYATPPHIAATIINIIHMSHGDIEGKFIADLGCGTGRLAIGSLLSGASLVYGFDIDRSALEQTLKNVCDVFSDKCEDDDDIDNLGSEAFKSCSRLSLLQADLASDELFWASFENKFDTVIMNPPFGTKQNRGLDMRFLERAVKMSAGVVYSLHKSSTREYIKGKCLQWHVEGVPVAQISYNLDKSYKFHKRKSVDIDVDLWRIDCACKSE